jgi:hypothetical protein
LAWSNWTDRLSRQSISDDEDAVDHLEERAELEGEANGGGGHGHGHGHAEDHHDSEKHPVSHRCEFAQEQGLILVSRQSTSHGGGFTSGVMARAADDVDGAQVV